MPPDPRDIDALYGLEPVFEPGQAAPGLELVSVVAIRCPWCGEPNETQVELTTGDRDYIEDCTVCCQPMELSAEFREDGSLRRVRVQR